MERDKIIERLKKSFLEAFTELNNITGDETMEDIAEWDSLGHVRLMVSIENEFGINIVTDKYTNLTSFAEILDYLVQNHDALKT
jgi:acyl carrier protein